MLIGLTGEARSGKDTFAFMLCDFIVFETYAFALPIKNACCEIFGWTDDHVNGHLKEEVDPYFGVSPRKAMQTLGTEWGRNSINSDLWLLAAEKKIEETSDLIVTDVRFNNEAELIRKHGGIVVNIERPTKAKVRSHSSESGIAEHLINRTIVNAGTLEDLKNSAADLIDFMK